MKRIRTLLAAVALFVATVAVNAQPMSYDAMRMNARFLTDRMAYTLGLGAEILDDLYYINYDYICGVNDYLDDVALGYRSDDYYAVLAARDLALQALLSPYQWSRLIAIDYFYRPISFYGHRWRFSIYAVGSEGLPRISVPFDAVGVEVDIVTVGRQVDFSVALRRSVRFRVKVKMTVAVIPLFEPYLVIVAQRDIARAVIDVGRIIYVKVGFIEIRIHAAYDEICVKIGEAEIVTGHVYRFDPFAHKYLRALSRSRCRGDDGEYAEYHYQR